MLPQSGRTSTMSMYVSAMSASTLTSSHIWPPLARPQVYAAQIRLGKRHQNDRSRNVAGTRS